MNIARKAAKVRHQTVRYHLNDHPDFAAQAERAKTHAIDLLHTKAMQRCLEGDIEPAYRQGAQRWSHVGGRRHANQRAPTWLTATCHRSGKGPETIKETGKL